MNTIPPSRHKVGDWPYMLAWELTVKRHPYLAYGITYDGKLREQDLDGKKWRTLPINAITIYRVEGVPGKDETVVTAIIYHGPETRGHGYYSQDIIEHMPEEDLPPLLCRDQYSDVVDEAVKKRLAGGEGGSTL